MGLDGRVFRMLKFRTMRLDAESETGPVWTSPDDPRRTRVGALLRRTSVDELPQLWNVLRGDMSLVGPRPERPVFIERFRREIPGYMLRHKVRAGLTGWAQVHGWRGDTSLHERIEHDIYYIQNWSLGARPAHPADDALAGLVPPERLLSGAAPISMQARISARKRSPRKRSAWARIAAGSKRLRLRLEAPHGVGQRLGRLRRRSRRPVGARPPGVVEGHDGLGGAAAAEGDHRPSRGLGLDGHDAEVLLLRIDERAAARVEVGELGVAAAAEEARRSARAPASSRRARGAVARHDERAAELREGAQREVLALVGHEAADEQVEVVGRPPRAARSAPRRPAGYTTSASRPQLRRTRSATVCEIATIRWMRSGPLVRRSKRRSQATSGSGERAPQTAAEVGVGLVPHVAHGREAVAEVDGAGRRAHAPSRPRGCVESTRSQAGRRRRSIAAGKQRQQLPVVAGGAGQARERARGDAAATRCAARLEPGTWISVKSSASGNRPASSSSTRSPPRMPVSQSWTRTTFTGRGA